MDELARTRFAKMVHYVNPILTNNGTSTNYTLTHQCNSSDTTLFYSTAVPFTIYCLKACIVASVSVLIVASNIMNIYVLSKTCHIPKISRIFLLNLSVSDLFVGLISCVPTILPSVTGYWPYGDAWCQIAGIVHGTSVTISIWSISMISIDRFLAICKPMTYASWRSSRKAYGVIACLWTLAVATFFSPLPTKPDLVYYRYSMDENICGLYWEYKWFCVVTAVYIPVLSGGILIYTNIRIMKTILNRKQNLDKMDCRSSMPRRGMNAVKMLMITSSIYFLAWGPYVTEVVLISFVDTIRVPGLVKFFTMWLANSNSFMNVIIFSFVYRSFRHEIKLVFIRCFYCVMNLKKRFYRRGNNNSKNNTSSEAEHVAFRALHKLEVVRADVYVFNTASNSTFL